MELSTKITYKARHALAWLEDALAYLMAATGVGVWLWALWAGGWLRWVAVGVGVLCSVGVVAAGWLAARADEEWAKEGRG